MSAYTKFKNAYFAFLEGIVVVLVIALAGVVTIGFVSRYLGSPLSWYDELAAVLLAWVTYYGAALAAAKGAHITCPSVLNMCPPSIRVPVALLAEAITIGFFIFLGLASYQVMLILDGMNMVSLPAISMQVVQSAIPIASVLFIIAELLRLPDIVRSARGKGFIDHELEEAGIDADDIEAVSTQPRG
ncbi:MULTISPECIES: TRAP transporter small permease [Halomonadaceae]|jgi:TRAP-type C4-dicarboxylate transport system permease small subunit|uniref:TRAP transporter small permease protein n=1 Tax=Vreelandella piezotolerans TaxID=2609667 RepID=A0ABQ6XBK4_9GAMM|nr:MULTISPECIES: TRAP transporter small permease [Halomonas]KFC51162.1 C4-dicarboxylate ABC transporter permease [Halomonas sp. SUBG004]KAE8439359.1 TRAP transporter small permease [Halomonas piezotolerans]MCG7591186.1 TRAP transporter small permease [Halomonas sp. McD50-5]MCG7617150.1 TRAP transporter small permease [Halomonas sp. McD50-4]QJA25122.1 TRAP transporter small permease [Halomonas piezotolerans]